MEAAVPKGQSLSCIKADALTDWDGTPACTCPIFSVTNRNNTDELRIQPQRGSSYCVPPPAYPHHRHRTVPTCPCLGGHSGGKRHCCLISRPQADSAGKTTGSMRQSSTRQFCLLLMSRPCLPASGAGWSGPLVYTSQSSTTASTVSAAPTAASISSRRAACRDCTQARPSADHALRRRGRSGHGQASGQGGVVAALYLGALVCLGIGERTGGGLLGGFLLPACFFLPPQGHIRSYLLVVVR